MTLATPYLGNLPDPGHKGHFNAAWLRMKQGKKSRNLAFDAARGTLIGTLLAEVSDD